MDTSLSILIFPFNICNRRTQYTQYGFEFPLFAFCTFAKVLTNLLYKALHSVSHRRKLILQIEGGIALHAHFLSAILASFKDLHPVISLRGRFSPGYT